MAVSRTVDPDISERHEIRVRSAESTIVFIASSDDGRLTIRQERDGASPDELCTITLADADELQAFFKGLHRTLAALGHAVGAAERPLRTEEAATPARALRGDGERDRDAVVEKARQRNAQAFTPWTRQEEQDVADRYRSGEAIEAIARAHKRSPRAIELRLQRLGVMPSGD